METVAGKPKVVVIGAGSLFFGRQAIWQMVHSPILNSGTLALVDTDERRLRAMESLARMAAADAGVALRIEADQDRRQVLRDADYVVLSFADRSVKFRGLDCAVALKYGVRMCSGDTIGPGGIFRTLRELPQIIACAKDIQDLCPGAWTINYINPTAANGIGLRRYAPAIRSFALCDSLHMPHVKRNYAKRAGLIEKDEEYTAEMDAEFDLRIAGVNHFTWLLKAEYRGRDLMPAIAEQIRIQAATETEGGDIGAKGLFNNRIGYALYEIYGKVPCCVGHTKEYVRFWQGLGRTPEPIPPLSIWETAERYKRHENMWAEVDDFVSGRRPIAEFYTLHKPDHATDVIENMAGRLGRPFFVNTFNDGAVSNMADDAFLELCCDFDETGPRPRAVGAFPRGLRAMQEQVLDTHELTAEAAVTCDRRILRRAMLTDPMISSIADGDAMIEELLASEREVLPAAWF